MTYFPSDDITGYRMHRFYAFPRAWEKVTDSYEFEDGGKTFNEVADNAPRRWEVVWQGLTPTEAQTFDDFYDTVRRSQPFNFRDKYGTIWSNVRVEKYERGHVAHKSWVVECSFVLVSFAGTTITALAVPTGLAVSGTTSSSVTLDWDALTQNVVYGSDNVKYGADNVTYTG